MKVIQIQSFGGSDKLRVEEVSRPRIKPDQVLVRIHDAGVNPIDWKIREGTMKEMRPTQFPLVIGQDFAGEIVEVGKSAKGFQKGDRVFGFADGSYAEFAAVSPKKIAKIPDALDYVTAAGLPTAGLTAYQLIVKEVRPSQRTKVLIHGAAGGVGSIAVQIAKHLGATVVANASGEDAQYLRSIGADEVIDRKRQRFYDEIDEVDAVVDLVGGDVIEKSYSLVKKGGILVSTVGAANEEKGRLHGIHATSFFMEPDAADLTALAKLVEQGKVTPRLGKVLPFAEARFAQDLNQTGKSHGKVILEIYKEFAA